MFMFKRGVCVLGVIVGALLPISCGDDGNDNNDEPTATDPQPVEISFMLWWNEGGEAEIDRVNEVLQAFNDSQDEIVVKSVPVLYDDYVSEIDRRSETNTLPDAAMMQESRVVSLAIEGKLADVSDMYDADNPPLKDVAFTYQGRTVAYSVANEVLLLYYNKDMFQAAGVDMPPASAEDAWTWDELVTAAKQLTVDSAGLTPNDEGFDPDSIVTFGMHYIKRAWFWPEIASSLGSGGIVSEDGSTLDFAHEDTITAAQAIADLALVEHVSPTPDEEADYLDPSIAVNLVEEKVAMVVSGQWEIGTSLSGQLDNGLNYGVGVLPIMDENSAPVTYNTGGAIVAFNTSNHPEETKTFLKWYGQPENNLAMINSGIWMPILKNWYTDDDLISKWAETSVHPDLEEYKSAVIDYALNYSRQVPWYYIPRFDEMESAIESGMEDVWDGTKSAEDVISNDIGPGLQSILDEINQ